MSADAVTLGRKGPAPHVSEHFQHYGQLDEAETSPPGVGHMETAANPGQPAHPRLGQSVVGGASSRPAVADGQYAHQRQGGLAQLLVFVSDGRSAWAQFSASAGGRDTSRPPS